MRPCSIDGASFGVRVVAIWFPLASRLRAHNGPNHCQKVRAPRLCSLVCASQRLSNLIGGARHLSASDCVPRPDDDDDGVRVSESVCCAGRCEPSDKQSVTRHLAWSIVWCSVVVAGGFAFCVSACCCFLWQHSLAPCGPFVLVRSLLSW